VQAEPAYPDENPAPPEGHTGDRTTPAAEPGRTTRHQPAAHVPSAWEEAERELAARQAEREHIHRERVVRELTVQAEALADAVRAAQQLGTVAATGAVARTGRREDTTARKTGRRHPAGAASGGAVETTHADHEQPADDEPLRYDALYDGADADTDALPDDGAPARRRTPATSAVGNRARRQRPAPLAMWAHRGHHVRARRSQSAEAGGGSHQERTLPVNELHALLKELNIPPALAEIGFAAGCRIGRVRIKRRPGPRPVEKNAPVVILSRRALERLRPVAIRRSPPEAAVARG